MRLEERLRDAYERLPVPAPGDRDAYDRFLRRRRLHPVVLAARAGLAVTVVGALVAGVVWMLPHDRGATQGGPPRDPRSAFGLTMQLDPSRARAGGVVTRTFHGARVHQVGTGVDADFQRWDGHRWVKIYTLIGGERGDPAAYAVGHEPRWIPDLGLPGDRPKRLRVPSVPPGEYRIAERVSVQRDVGAPVQEVVYGRLRITG
jgi:hypothetical protein